MSNFTSVAYAIHFATVKSGSVVLTPRPKYSLRVIFSNTVVAILSPSDSSSFLGGVLAVDGVDDELMTEYMLRDVDQPELLQFSFFSFLCYSTRLDPALIQGTSVLLLGQIFRSASQIRSVQCSLQLVVLRPILYFLSAFYVQFCGSLHLRLWALSTQ